MFQNNVIVQRGEILLTIKNAGFCMKSICLSFFHPRIVFPLFLSVQRDFRNLYLHRAEQFVYFKFSAVPAHSVDIILLVNNMMKSRVFWTIYLPIELSSVGWN